MEFSGQVVVIAGAARGIGAATARAFGAAGADVVVGDVLDASLVVEEIRQMGRRALLRATDVTREEQVDALVASAAAELGRLDVYVACAAFSQRGSFLDVSLESVRRTIDVTMWGPFYGVRAAARQMVRQGQGGSIVVISSPHAVVPVPGSMAYNMAKAAVDHMARTAAAELFEHRIRVNIVHPGWTDTPGERNFYSEEEIATQGARLPCRRLARPDEIARGILFLASKDSEYINGTILRVDGGLAVWLGSMGRSPQGKFQQ